MVRLILSGDLDDSFTRDLMDLVRTAERHTGPIEVDTQAVGFVDSAVIAVFAALDYRQPGRLRFVNTSESVRFLLELIQLGKLIEVVDDAS
ncbi:STAS domain-containing protein [Georgenia thermotolerans]|nr:STAS domain-containing protein [Georgenia thermotolerans]